MKTNILCYVLCIGMVAPVIVMGAPIQNLDRVNDLVNSARAMADGLRNNGPVVAQDSVPMVNPFSSTSVVGGNVGVQARNGTGVEVGENNIRINAGGMQYNIPRIGTGPGPSGLTLPNLRANEAIREAAYFTAFADSVQAFKQADFATASAKIKEASLARTHQFQEFHSLCCFATGDYNSAAELAYAWAAKHPVSGWNQLRGYYGQRRVYANQYVALQEAANQAAGNASVKFLLGYHHLMLGHREHAAAVLNEVLKQLPNDPVVTRMLRECELGPPAPIAK